MYSFGCSYKKIFVPNLLHLDEIMCIKHKMAVSFTMLYVRGLLVGVLVQLKPSHADCNQLNTLHLPFQKCKSPKMLMLKKLVSQCLLCLYWGYCINMAVRHDGVLGGDLCGSERLIARLEKHSDSYLAVNIHTPGGCLESLALAETIIWDHTHGKKELKNKPDANLNSRSQDFKHSLLTVILDHHPNLLAGNVNT